MLANVSWAASPRKYGAFGDGVHDDTKALQECINNEKVVNLQKRTYYISSIDIRSSVKIKNGTIVSCLQKNILQIYGTNNVCIQNVVIDGSGTCENAIFARESNSIKVKKCSIHSLKTIDDCTSGIYFVRVRNSYISGCNVSKIEGIPNGKVGDGCGASRAIILQQCHDIQILGNYIFDIISAEDGDGIHCIDEVDRTDNRLIIEDNDIKNCSRRLIKIQAPGIVIRNNRLYTEGQNFFLDYGISIFDSNVDITNNAIDINTPIPLSVSGTYKLHNININRNTITDHGYANQGSITIGRPAMDIFITDNSFNIIDSKQTSVFIRNNTENIEIIGNVVKGGRGIALVLLDVPEKKVSSISIEKNTVETSFCFMSIYADNDDQINALSVEQNTIEISNANNQKNPIYISSKSKTLRQKIHYNNNNHKGESTTNK